MEPTPLVSSFIVAGLVSLPMAWMQISTIAGWSLSFYRAWDATSVVSLLYFVIIIVVVAYIMVNLFMAVLKLKFAAASREQLLEAPLAAAQKVLLRFNAFVALRFVSLYN